MKRFKLFILLLCVSCVLSAQVSTQNYVRSRIILNENGSSYMDNISYLDGLGRPFQVVQKAVKNDIRTGSILATLQEYDAIGREAKSWLPTVISSDYTTPASLKIVLLEITEMTPGLIVKQFMRLLHYTVLSNNTRLEQCGIMVIQLKWNIWQMVIRCAVLIIV